MDDVAKIEEQLQEGIRKIVREEIQKLRPIEIIGLNFASAEEFVTLTPTVSLGSK